MLRENAKPSQASGKLEVTNEPRYVCFFLFFVRRRHLCLSLQPWLHDAIFVLQLQFCFTEPDFNYLG